MSEKVEGLLDEQAKADLQMISESVKTIGELIKLKKEMNAIPKNDIEIRMFCVEQGVNSKCCNTSMIIDTSSKIYDFITNKDK